VLSRNEKDLRKKFPEVKDSIAVIDGEIVALDEKGPFILSGTPGV
jgi:ATP-dependent DNA ligase